MRTVKVKTAELAGPALDWAVAKSMGFDITRIDRHCIAARYWSHAGTAVELSDYNPSINWRYGGTLIDKFQIEILFAGGMAYSKLSGSMGAGGCGQTPLVAACRAIVMNNLGDEVEVPADLVEGAQ